MTGKLKVGKVDMHGASYNKKLLISDDISIIDAFKRLDETAGKALLVVGAENILLGSLTDGDIRRYLLSGNRLEDNISGAFKRNPIFILDEEYSVETARKILLRYKLSLLPIVDKTHRVVNVVFWDKLFDEDNITRMKRKRRIHVPVVIMAGGKGTRLDPFTKILPKPLIPVGDKPVIELIMDKFHECGMQDFHITLNHRSKMIRAYFEEFKTKYSINYIDEEQPLGTAGGLRFLPHTVKGPIFVSNSDIIIEEDYAKILNFHNRNKNVITIVASIKNYDIPYGVCEIENGGVLKNINEKPSYSFLVNTGMYILNSSVLALIPKGEFYHITDLIQDAKSKGNKVGVFPISEKSWIDIGEWEKYKKALEHFKL